MKNTRELKKKTIWSVAGRENTVSDAHDEEAGVRQAITTLQSQQKMLHKFISTPTPLPLQQEINDIWSFSDEYFVY